MTAAECFVSLRMILISADISGFYRPLNEIQHTRHIKILWVYTYVYMLSFGKRYLCNKKNFTYLQKKSDKTENTRAAYTPPLNTGLLSQWDCISCSSHTTPVQIGNFMKLLCRCVQLLQTSHTVRTHDLLFERREVKPLAYLGIIHLLWQNSFIFMKTVN